MITGFESAPPLKSLPDCCCMPEFKLGSGIPLSANGAGVFDAFLAHCHAAHQYSNASSKDAMLLHREELDIRFGLELSAEDWVKMDDLQLCFSTFCEKRNWSHPKLTPEFLAKFKMTVASMFGETVVTGLKNNPMVEM